MNLILKISVRNLLRQKRRNLLLGLGIALGMCFLMMANSLGAGISDLLLNKMVESFSGHLFVTMKEKNIKKWEIIRNKDRIQQAILENVEGVKAIREHVAAYGRALGNGKAMFAPVFGIDPQSDFFQGVPVVAGNIADMTNPAIEHPLALYESMADRLNVQVRDVISMRFESVYGQVQVARFTVVAIMKAVNPFFRSFMYCPMEQLKPLVGYQPHETNSLQIVLDRVTDPKQLIEQANRLHAALNPGIAGYQGVVHSQNHGRAVTVVAVEPNQTARQAVLAHFQPVSGSVEDTFADEEAVMLSQTLAEALGVGVGDQVRTQYMTRFEQISEEKECRIGAIFKANDVIRPETMFVPAQQLYATVFPFPPGQSPEISAANPISSALVKEWKLLNRTEDQRSSQKKYRALNLTDWRGAILDVRTIHEVAGEVLEFTDAINLVTVVGVVILFFIIQIGVVNTLRMTIRERTREIGTVRAIGMQREEVRWAFVTEVTLLTLFACIVGIVMALLFIQGLSAISIDTGDSEMGFFLMNNHLYFVPRIADMVRNLGIILIIALLTAYIPARRAAKLSVVEALRHYE